MHEVTRTDLLCTENTSRGSSSCLTSTVISMDVLEGFFGDDGLPGLSSIPSKW